MNNPVNSRSNLRPHENPTYFEEANIRLVWNELSTRFGFPLKEWKKRFSDYCNQERVKNEIEGFYKFGNSVINPVLNEILCRKKGYPTFHNLFEYVVKKGGR